MGRRRVAALNASGGVLLDCVGSRALVMDLE